MIALRFSTSRRKFSRLISLFTWSKWTHVETVMPNGDLIGSLASSGVTISGNICTERRGSYRYLPIPVNEEKYYEFTRKQLGKPYDLGGVFGFLFRKEKWNSTNKWFCSELCAAAIQESYEGGKLFGYGYSRITPGDIFQWTIPATREEIINDDGLTIN